MGRKHWHSPKCRLCGKPNHDGSRVSATGLCYTCGNQRLNENHNAMLTLSGPYAQWWAYRMAESVGLAPLDVTPKPP